MKYIFILLSLIICVGCKSVGVSHAGHDHSGHNQSHDHSGHDHEESDQGIEKGDAPLDVTIETVVPSTFNQIIKTSGRIQSPQGEEVVVAATSSGVVTFAGTLAEGAAVKKGQTIATVRDPEARGRIERETAEREYRRAEQLIEDQIISQREFNEARRRYETARTASATSVSSPLAGYVKSLSVVSGSYVAVGQPIAAIVTSNKLQLRAEVSERYFGALSGVTGARFKSPYSDEVYHADRLLSYGRSTDGAYIPVLFEFDNVGDILPGSYVEVWLLGAPIENVISIPKTALTEEQGLYFVYVSHGEGDFHKTEVALGADDGERVQVLAGLKSGDRVVTRGAMQVRLATMSAVIPEGHSH